MVQWQQQQYHNHHQQQQHYGGLPPHMAPPQQPPYGLGPSASSPFSPPPLMAVAAVPYRHHKAAGTVGGSHPVAPVAVASGSGYRQGSPNPRTNGAGSSSPGRRTPSRSGRKRTRGTQTPPLPPPPSSTHSTDGKQDDKEDEEEEDEEEEDVSYALQLRTGLLTEGPSPTRSSDGSSSSPSLLARVRADFAELCAGLGGKFQGCVHGHERIGCT